MAEVDQLLKLLCSHIKLDRDRGGSSLETLLSDQREGLAASQLSSFQKSLITLVQSNDENWEIKHGGLLGARLVILARKADHEFLETMKQGALVLMHDDEFRVRILAGNVI